jgi:hypothetical protein
MAFAVDARLRFLEVQRADAEMPTPPASERAAYKDFLTLWKDAGPDGPPS